MKTDKKTYYGFYLDCVGGILTFKTRKEAEEVRQGEIDNSEPDFPMDDSQISEVFEVKMTDEEWKNRIEI